MAVVCTHLKCYYIAWLYSDILVFYMLIMWTNIRHNSLWCVPKQDHSAQPKTIELIYYRLTKIEEEKIYILKHFKQKLCHQRAAVLQCVQMFLCRSLTVRKTILPYCFSSYLWLVRQRPVLPHGGAASKCILRSDRVKVTPY